MRYGIDVGRSGVKVASNGSRIFLPSIIGLKRGAQSHDSGIRYLQRHELIHTDRPQPLG